MEVRHTLGCRMQAMCKELDQDEQTLREKIDKKTIDLDR